MLGVVVEGGANVCGGKAVGKHTNTCAPRHYFSLECFLGGVTAYVIPEVGAEGGANACVGKVVEKHTNICLGAVLEWDI